MVDILEKDFVLPRGDTHSEQFSFAFEHSAVNSYRFVLKRSMDETDDRLIEKYISSNDVIFENGIATITIDFISTDSGDLIKDSYPYDITALSSADPLFEKRVVIGSAILKKSVSTNLDGTDLPEDAERHIAVLARYFEAEHYIKVIKNASGNQQFSGSFFPTKGLTEIDTNGDIMPVENVIDVIDEQFELDINGDLMPRL